MEFMVSIEEIQGVSYQRGRIKGTGQEAQIMLAHSEIMLTHSEARVAGTIVRGSCHFARNGNLRIQQQ